MGSSLFNGANNTTINNITNDSINVTLNDSNGTNNTTTVSSSTSSKKSSSKKSSSDDIPSEGTYKGVEYSLSDGYPYYSAQNDKVYHNKREAYDDMKRAVDSGIAD